MSLEDIDDDDFSPIPSTSFEPQPSLDFDDGSNNNNASTASYDNNNDRNSTSSASPPNNSNKESHRNTAGDAKAQCVQLTEEQINTDWYAILKSSCDATPTELKRAYQKRCLETHPDKNPTHDDGPFKEVVKAYAVLGNAELRRAYDSVAPFDDTIPDDKKYTSEEFYETFGAVFLRNQRWSSRKAPHLGDDTTPIADIQKFYAFWNSFKSWRDFSHLVEAEECEDECREIRRRIQRERTRKVEKLRQKEAKRIATLVERAYKCDPRIRRMNEEEKLDRLRAQKEREAERAAAEANAQRKKEEDEVRLKQEQLDKKAAQKAEAQLKRETRAQILDLLKKHNCFDDTQGESMALDAHTVRKHSATWLLFNCTDVHTLRKQIDDVIEETNSSNNNNNNDCATALAELFNNLIKERECEVGIDRYGMHISASTRTATTTTSSLSPTTTPSKKTAAASTNNNNAVLSQTSSSSLPTQPLAATANDKAEAAAAAPVPSTAASASTTTTTTTAAASANTTSKDYAGEWSAAELSALQKAVAKYPGGSVDRWEKMAQYLGNTHTAKQILLKTREVEGSWGIMKSANVNSTTATAAAATAAASDTSDTSTAAHTEVSAAALGVDVSASATVWSASQQKAFENALRTLKEYKEKDKWDKIAALVEGKTKSDCVARYKVLSGMKK